MGCIREPTWEWLSEPLALDFANTVHWHGTTEVDHIADAAGVCHWLAHEPHELPPCGTLDADTHSQLVALRDATRRTLRRLADGVHPHASDVGTINAAARAHPTTRCIDPVSLAGGFEAASAHTDPLIGHLAAVVIALITDPGEVQRLGFCTAPHCGGLYRQTRPNQRWCHPDCGARARAERQYRRRQLRTPASGPPAVPSQ